LFVTLSQAAATPVTYTIATSNGTATAGSDYVASTLSGQTIPAGQTAKTFNVTLNGDTAVEANEVFYVTLSNAAGASIAKASAVGTLTNDDGPTLSVADAEDLRPVVPAGRITVGCMQDLSGRTSNRRATLTACMKHSCCSSAGNLNSDECRAYQKAYPYTCGAG